MTDETEDGPSTLFGRLDAPCTADLFCGGGGASLGIANATGWSPFVAINHNQHAIETHALNHPDTIHLQEDVFEVVPRRAVCGRRLHLLWASPQCTHFSTARGSKPMRDQERSQADVVILWAKEVRPDVICLENVVEWLQWGPLHPSDHPNRSLRDRPIEDRKGESFRAWVSELEALGYVVEWRVLRADEFGCYTSRKRVYLVARCDGKPIRWPKRTHGPGRIPFRWLVDKLDLTDLGHSIFMSQDEAKRRKLKIRRPLKDATTERIVKGVIKHILEAKDPYIFDPVTLKRVDAGGARVVAPMLYQMSHGGRPRAVTGPMHAITATPKGGDTLLVGVVLDKQYGTATGSPVTKPIGSITAGAGGGHHALIAVSLAKHFTGVTGHGVTQPIGAITATDHHSLTAAVLVPEGSEVGLERAALAASYIMSYYSGGGTSAPVDGPLPTIVTVARHALVTVMIDSATYVLTDIYMRMLRSDELMQLQGFPKGYKLPGKEADKIGRIGNSVVPWMAELIVRAQGVWGSECLHE